MDANVAKVMEQKLARAQKALCEANMEAFIAKTAADVPALVKGMLHAGDKVACGGSATLAECGVMDIITSGAYTFLDRGAPGADRAALERAAFEADVYFASANAVTMQGEVYEVDGHCNRSAAIAYGPNKVVLVVGVNKLVEDLAAARRRGAEVAAPANVQRLNKNTPCHMDGVCEDAACRGTDRLCCTELVLRAQSKPDRVKVILVGEALGY